MLLQTIKNATFLVFFRASLGQRDASCQSAFLNVPLGRFMCHDTITNCIICTLEQGVFKKSLKYLRHDFPWNARRYNHKKLGNCAKETTKHYSHTQNLAPNLARRYNIAFLDGTRTVSTSYVLSFANMLSTFPGA